MSEVKEKNKIETMFIQVYDMRGSGFILDGTEGTPFQQELNCPEKQIIPNMSWRRRADGGNEQTRYIYGVDEISVQKQKELGIEPSGMAKTDKIVIERGSATIAKEGANIGLYNYLKSCYWNASNPDRSENATPYFKVIDLTSLEETRNELDLARNEAAGFVYTLQEKRKDVWVYQEERINALCELFTVYATSFAGKISALVGLANLAPVDFLNKVKIFEQTAATMIAHALQLNVIKFEGNTAMYLIKNKIIKNLGAGDMKQDMKIDQLSQFLRSADGKELYRELEAEVTVAKENKLNN